MRILLLFFLLNFSFGCGIKDVPEEKEGKMNLFLEYDND
tara:strand:+ start:436 stop:552 length:117 start_codon:yes stop_codon:yes gene_type:complete